MPQSRADSTLALAEEVEDGAFRAENVAVNQFNRQVVPVSTRNSLFRRWKLNQNGVLWRKCLALSVVVNIVLVPLLCFLAISWGTQKKTSPVDVCRTKDCIDSAHRLLSAIDKEVNPCDDFYQFACGNWMNRHMPDETQMRISQFSQTTKMIVTDVQDILENKVGPEDRLPVQQAKELYKACMNTGDIENLSVSPITEVLEMMGLPTAVLFDNVTGNFSLARTLALIQYHLKLSDLIFTVDFEAHPENNSRRILQLYPSDVKITLADRYKESIVGPDPRYFSDRKRRSASQYVEDEIRYRSIVMETFESASNSAQRMESSKFRVAALKTLVLESQIAGGRTDSDSYRMMTLSELQNETDTYVQSLNTENISNQIDWLFFMQTLLKDVQDLPEDLWNPLMVYDLTYFQNLAAILAKTKTESLQRLIWWKVVDRLTVYSTEALRRLRYVKNGHYEIISRTEECLQLIENMMPLAVLHKIATQPKMNLIKQRVEEMMADIRVAFAALLREAKWMDEKTRNHAISKLRAMNMMIAYSDYLVEPGYIEEEYSGVTINRREYLKSVLSVLTADSKRALRLLDSAPDFRNLLQNPFLVNAFNVVRKNFIVIPTGILHTPMYGLGLEVMNYAALGTILGHEVTHGFDNIGRLYDKDGRKSNWWSNSTSEEFIARQECFVQQYSNYTVRGKFVDGDSSLSENIADNGGIREAFRAYRKYNSRKRPELKLPGLEEVTHEQLFFLTFAHTWCAMNTERADLKFLDDVHSPSRYRVIGTLSNIEEFSKAWQCPVGSPMNPTEKCVLW